MVQLIIQDEVNIKIEGLPVDVRRKVSNKLKFEVPYARYMPQYKLGRWDGKVGFFGLGGNFARFKSTRVQSNGLRQTCL